MCQQYHAGMLAPMRWRWQTLDGGCFRAAKTVGTYLKWLQQSNVPSNDARFPDHSLSELLAAVESPSSPRPEISTEQQRCSMYSCICKDDEKPPNNFNLTDKLAEVCVQLRRRVETLICLDCIKTDG